MSPPEVPAAPVKIGRSIDEFEVGQRREFSHVFRRAETEQMAELIGDHNPFHFAGPFVERTRFRRPIVHGMLVGGMICHFGGDLFPGPGYLAETMDFHFLHPVYFGERVRAVGEVTAVDRARRRVTFAMTCYNEAGVKVATARVVGIPYQVDMGDDATPGTPERADKD